MKWLVAIIIIIAGVFVFFVLPYWLHWECNDPFPSERSAVDRLVVTSASIRSAVSRAKGFNSNNLHDVETEYDEVSSELAASIDILKSGVTNNSIDDEVLSPSLSKAQRDAELLLQHLKAKATITQGEVAPEVGETVFRLIDQFEELGEKAGRGWIERQASIEKCKEHALQDLDNLKWPNWADIRPGL